MRFTSLLRQLLRDLLIAAGKFRVNQGEAKEFFYKTVRQTVAAFVNGTITAEEEEAERVRALSDDGSDGRRYRGTSGEDPLGEYKVQLDVLRALAATGPGNLRAAENVAASVSSALIRAAGERTVDLLQLHQSAVEKRCVDIDGFVVFLLLPCGILQSCVGFCSERNCC